MIITAIMNGITYLLNLLSPLRVTQLPWGLDIPVSSAITGYKALAEYFPVFNTILVAFAVYMGLLVSLKMIRILPLIGKFID